MHFLEASTGASAAGVVCSGNIVYDTLVRPVDDLCWGHGTTFVENIECHVGGNGANTAQALAILGVPVRLLGVVGDDDQGRFVLQKLKRPYLDISGVLTVASETSATVGFVNSKGERKFFHRFGSSQEAFKEPIRFHPELCEGVSHYHLASLFVLPRLRPRGPEVLGDARKAGLTTSLDTNWDPENQWMRTLEPCLPQLDILFMNEVEAPMITGTRDPAISARMVLDRGVRIAVMKLGGRGCGIYTAHEQIICPAYDVEAKDTTGAGDCFVAGFLAALQHNASLAEAGQFANAVAALSVECMGAVTGVRNLADTQAWMSRSHLREEGGVDILEPW